MTEQNPSKGRLSARLNPNKQTGDKRPAFQGTLTLNPGDGVRHVALWVHPTKKGAHIITGRAGDTALEQIADLAQPKPPPAADELIRQAQSTGRQFAVDVGDIVLFPADKDPERPKAPDYWGYFNPGHDIVLQRVAIWAKTDAQGRATLSGTVEPLKAEPEATPSRSLTRSRKTDRSR